MCCNGRNLEVLTALASVFELTVDLVYCPILFVIHRLETHGIILEADRVPDHGFRQCTVRPAHCTVTACRSFVDVVEIHAVKACEGILVASIPIVPAEGDVRLEHRLCVRRTVVLIALVVAVRDCVVVHVIVVWQTKGQCSVRTSDIPSRCDNFRGAFALAGGVDDVDVLPCIVLLHN